MDKTPVYIKKILSLILIIVTGLFLSNFLNYYIIIPFCFFSLAFLFYRITGEKPNYLFGLESADNFLQKKGGFWLLFKWILILLGLLYDIIAMTLNGVFYLFLLFIDLLLLIKTILYWIVHGVLWFLKLFIPPLIFIYKIIIHYIIKWPWWIYKLTFRNTGISINRNFYFVSFRGSFFSLLIFFVFHGSALIANIRALSFLGVVLASLPLAWASGAISCMREKKLSEESFSKAKICFGGGTDTIRVFILYLSFVMIFLLTEISLNLLGWIPSIGFSLLGIAINVNTLITIFLLFLFVLLLFANMMLPAYIIKTKNIHTSFRESIFFLGIIGKKFLRYIASIVPAAFFSAVLMLIPAIVISIAIFLTISLRDVILDARIGILKERMIVSKNDDLTQINKNIKLLQFYKTFPQNTFKEFAGIKQHAAHINQLKNDLFKAEENIKKIEGITLLNDSLRKKAEILSSSPVNSETLNEIEEIELKIQHNSSEYKSWMHVNTSHLQQIKSDISFSETIIYQLPVVLLLTAIWTSLFLGIILSVLISYLSNVFYELYNFREDGKVSYFVRTIRGINIKDNNQPLLGFTLLILCIVLIILFLPAYNWF